MFNLKLNSSLIHIQQEDSLIRISVIVSLLSAEEVALVSHLAQSKLLINISILLKMLAVDQIEDPISFLQSLLKVNLILKDYSMIPFQERMAK